MICFFHRRRWESQATPASRQLSILAFPRQPAKAVPLTRWLPSQFTASATSGSGNHLRIAVPSLQKILNTAEETLTYMDFPSEHWLKIRTNNVIERLNREIRRRTRVVGTFPDGNSALIQRFPVPLDTGDALHPPRKLSNRLFPSHLLRLQAVCCCSNRRLFRRFCH